jgi:hypothetical protein
LRLTAIVSDSLASREQLLSQGRRRFAREWPCDHAEHAACGIKYQLRWNPAGACGSKELAVDVDEEEIAELITLGICGNGRRKFTNRDSKYLESAIAIGGGEGAQNGSFLLAGRTPGGK